MEKRQFYWLNTSRIEKLQVNWLHISQIEISDRFLASWTQGFMPIIQEIGPKSRFDKCLTNKIVVFP